MAVRTLALPMLARSAIRATDRAHLPLVWASIRMPASTADASVLSRSAIEGGTTTGAARNRRPHTTHGIGLSPPSKPLHGRQRKKSGAALQADGETRSA